MKQSDRPEERFLVVSKQIIRVAVRTLAVMMIIVILAGTVDVGWILYQKLMAPPKYILSISDMFSTFGAFMAVLIAIEIFVNIVLYLRDDVIHVKIVVATALMASARKVIILDFDTLHPFYTLALAGVVLATSIAYWLIHKKQVRGKSHGF